MTLFKEAMCAGGALCCLVFALDMSTPRVSSSEQRDTTPTVVKSVAPDFQAERDTRKAAVGSPPATDETRSSEAETAAVAAPTFANLKNGREEKRERQKRTVRRVSPRSSDTRVANAQATVAPTWNDSGWSWNQSWQSSARQYPRRNAGQSSWSDWSFYRQRRGSPNSCPWC
jgi:hypothetical protein